MPREFYPDTERNSATRKNKKEELCLHEVPLFDGPAICTREKNHLVDKLGNPLLEAGEFHQEEYEGWVWDNNGAVA